MLYPPELRARPFFLILSRFALAAPEEYFVSEGGKFPVKLAAPAQLRIMLEIFEQAELSVRSYQQIPFPRKKAFGGGKAGLKLTNPGAGPVGEGRIR